MLRTLKQQIFAQKVYLCYAMQYHCNRKDCRKLHIITFLSRISPEFHQKEKESHEIFVTLWFSVWTSQGLNLGPPDYEFKELANGKEFSIDKKTPNFTFFGCKTGCKPCKSLIIRRYCGERGIRTPGASQHDGFQDRCNRPLYHLSFCLSRQASSHNR